MSRSEYVGELPGQSTKKALREAKVTYRRIVELTEELTPHESVPRLEAQQDHVTELQDRVRATTSEAEETERRLEENEKTTVELSEALRTFGEEYGRPPGAVLVEAKKHVQERGELPSLIRRLNGERRRLRKDLEGTLGDRLDAMREYDLTDTAPAEAEDMLEAIKAAHRKASEQLASKTIEVQQAALSRVNGRITQIDDELQEIEERLKSVEKTVIAEAAVVAATLTGAYLRDAIQERRFDTVILDEASMAPIPALWIAAALAEANVVVVGDFKQLPPIVLSRHELAKQWLGRDIFEVAGLPARHARGDAPSHFIPLRSQYRMHPEIRAIPNELFYDRYLTDGEGAGENTTLADWHREDWGYDAPVLLVDTGSTNAWVTSVPRGGARSSRLNFLSATICVDLAEALLREDRAPLEEGVDPRILIGCPYRPHARLLQLLLRDQSLDADVLAGTTHTFQGGEADLVILDLVNDEPHWRVGMCMPERDDNTKRLLNVALTRARARLIVVGDFDYIAKISKRAFMGREFLPFLNRHYPKVDALDLVPAGLAGRAARAQIVSSGGPVEADADRTVVTQDRFYPLVTSDLEAATDRVVIYSPFMTQNRVGELEPHLRAAVERGVEVYVVTKTQEERGKRDLETYRSMEGGLRSWGITVIHKRRMHEKLIFVDREVLWSGSLNPLSFRSSQEVMERRVSRTVVNDFAGTLRLDDLIAQYAQGETTCPICGSEVVPSEGRNEPFYWRCVAKDCYSRSIDDPPLQDGFLRCRSCNGPLRFGEWGNDWVWRCEENYRHRQPIARTHLKLPEMRSLIPEADLLELERRFGID